MSFDPLNAPVDFATIGGARTPGLCTVIDASWPRRIIEQNGFGLSGARSRFAGLAISKPILQIRLYTDDDWTAWGEFLPVVAQPPVGQRARALAIDHPILADFGITSVLVKDVKGPTQEENGVWMFAIELTQTRPLSFALSAPDGAATGPTDPLDIENDALAAEVTRLAGDTSPPT